MTIVEVIHAALVARGWAFDPNDQSGAEQYIHPETRERMPLLFAVCAERERERQPTERNSP